jgi:hypothetical protein
MTVVGVVAGKAMLLQSFRPSAETSSAPDREHQNDRSEANESPADQP